MLFNEHMLNIYKDTIEYVLISSLCELLTKVDQIPRIAIVHDESPQ